MYTPDGTTAEEMARNPYVCPESASDLSGLPPITGLVGGADILRDEGVAYFNAAAKAGVVVEWRQWDKAVHPVNVFPPNVKSCEDYIVSSLEIAFAASAVVGKKGEPII
jgi:acetyl esterase